MDGRVAAGRGDDDLRWCLWCLLARLDNDRCTRLLPVRVGVGVGKLESAVLLAAGLAQAAANAQDTMIRDDR
jgi:hypothetical protein